MKTRIIDDKRIIEIFEEVHKGHPDDFFILGFAYALLKEATPVAYFDKEGKIQGRVSDEQLVALCSNALSEINKRNDWE